MRKSSRRRHKEPQAAADSLEREKYPCFYVNVRILDASAAVYEKVQQKVSNITVLPFKKAVASRISGIVSDEAVTKRLARKLPKLLMYLLSQKGLRLHAETVFVHDTYLVLELLLLHADPVAFAQSVAEEAATQKLKESLIQECRETGIYQEEDEDADEECSISTQVLDDWLASQAFDGNQQVGSQYTVTSRLDAISSNNTALSRTTLLARIVQCLLDIVLSSSSRKRLESEYLPNIIQEIVARKMDCILRQKMVDKQVHSDTVVLSAQDQARYFFAQLRLLNGFGDSVKAE